MKVWLVYFGEYEDRDVECVGATEALALAEWEKRRTALVDMHRLAMSQREWHTSRAADALRMQPDVHAFEVLQLTRPSAPAPRMFQAIGRLNRTRSALASAVRNTDTLPELRAAVLELASDIEAFINGAEPASEIAEARRDTEPCPPPGAPWQHAEPSAPDVPITRPSGGP